MSTTSSTKPITPALREGRIIGWAWFGHGIIWLLSALMMPVMSRLLSFVDQQVQLSPQQAAQFSAFSRFLAALEPLLAANIIGSLVTIVASLGFVYAKRPAWYAIYWLTWFHILVIAPIAAWLSWQHGADLVQSYDYLGNPQNDIPAAITLAFNALTVLSIIGLGIFVLYRLQRPAMRAHFGLKQRYLQVD